MVTLVEDREEERVRAGRDRRRGRQQRRRAVVGRPGRSPRRSSFAVLTLITSPSTSKAKLFGAVITEPDVVQSDVSSSAMNASLTKPTNSGTPRRGSGSRSSGSWQRRDVEVDLEDRDVEVGVAADVAAADVLAPEPVESFGSSARFALPDVRIA